MLDPSLSIGARLLWLVISFHGNNDGKGAGPSRKELCEEMGISENTLDKLLHELTARKLITRTPRRKNGQIAHTIYDCASPQSVG